MSKHTIEDLKYKQRLPLEIKVEMTKRRIREWVREFGIEGTYVSFSGGKDSTVLLHIVREIYPTIPAVFCDTGLEYPEIRKFVRTFDNVVWIKPKLNFKSVIEAYGYPFISKEVSFALHSAKQFLQNKEKYADKKPLPVQNADDEYEPYALLKLEGKIGKADDGKGYSQFNCEKWHFMLDAPYNFGSKCCDIMKKQPFKMYGKETGRVPITAQMASESRLRKKNWLMHGCNMFDAKKPMSNPMSFWTEQDVLEYIDIMGLEVAPVYGNLLYSNGKYYFDGCQRTGCIFCGFGCHLEHEPNRFQRLKETHPKLYDYCMGGGEYNEDGMWQPNNKGLGMKHVMDFINVKVE